MSDPSARGQVNTSAAEIYESFFVPALFGEWAPRVLAAAEVGPGHTLVDVACGTGILARAAADVTGDPNLVTGIDINEGMLAIARQKAPAINWRTGAAEQLPIDDGSIDRAVSQFGIMFYEDRVRALKEMVRVLKPGGRLAVAVWGRAEDAPGYAAMIALLNRLFGADVADALRAPFNMGDLTIVTDLIRDAALVQAQVDTQIGTARFKSIDDWVHTDVKGWTLADLIDDTQFEELKKHAPAALKEFVQADASVAFPSPAHIITAVK